MKLSGRQAADFCRSPDPALAGALLYGPDEGVVAARRRELVAGLLGSEADAMRLERLEPAAIRRDPSALDTVLRSRGFFSGRAVVLIESVTDSLATVLERALSETAPEDAFLLATAGQLAGKSTLRRAFELDRRLISLDISAERLEPAEIRSRLEGLGARAGVSDGAVAQLMSLMGGMDSTAFERFLDTLGIFALGLDRALEADDVLSLSPSGLDAELDAFVAAVAGGRAEEIGPMIRRVTAAGANPVSLLISLQRHFRQLLIAASVEGGPEAGLGRIRPPLWGGRRDAVRAQLRAWRRERLEAAARLLFEADGRVRSAERAPALAVVERCALRLAMLAGR